MNILTSKFPTLPSIRCRQAHKGGHELVRQLNFLGRLLRDFVYYPLYPILAKTKECKHSKKLRYEEAYYSRFWSGEEPQDRNLEKRDMLRRKYDVADQRVVVLSADDREITTTCRIFEPRECQKENLVNVLLIPGALSTLNNNLFASYDFLVAQTTLRDCPDIRFFVFGHHEMEISCPVHSAKLYKPPSWEATGEALKRTLDALTERWGRFSLISAHSAGCLALASLLRLCGPEILPTTLHFDRGVSSIYEISRYYWFSGLLYRIAASSGLAINVDQEIADFVGRCAQPHGNASRNSTCLITGVEQDFVYPDRAGLIASDRLDGIAEGNVRVAKWVFNPPYQISHPRNHHGWRLSKFNKCYLTSSTGNTEMLPEENLAEALLRLALA